MIENCVVLRCSSKRKHGSRHCAHCDDLFRRQVDELHIRFSTGELLQVQEAELFLVYSSSHSSEHCTSDYAKTVALQLAKENRGERFYVLKIAGSAVCYESNWTDSNRTFVTVSGAPPF